MTIGPITIGRDWNFFQTLSVVNTEFASAPDMVITFTTQGILFLNQGVGTINVSFNGTTLHCQLTSGTPSSGISFDNRVVSPIWFCVASGTTPGQVVSVNAWSEQ